MENINSDFRDLWRRSNLSSENILELLLILILWRYLSEIVLSDGPDSNRWNDPGREYHFNSLKNRRDEDSKAYFCKVLNAWSETNKPLERIFYIDERNLNVDTISRAWSLVENITSDLSLPDPWSLKPSQSIFDKVSGSFLKDWQFAHEYFTPSDVSTLMAGFVKRNDDVTIYDPSCGSGDLLYAALVELPKVSKIEGVTQNSFMSKLTYIRLLLLNIPFDLFNSREEVKEKKFDIILTNPPFGVKGVSNKYADFGEWSRLPSSGRSEVKYLANILDRLSDKGIGVIVLPNGALSEKANVLLRKKMIEGNLLEAVIHLPKNIFYQTRVSASILIFNKQKTHHETIFIDASGLGIKSGDRVCLSGNDVQLILDLYNNTAQTVNPSKCRLIRVSRELLQNNEYDLQYAIYDTPVKRLPLRLSSEIIKECLVIENEIAAIKRKINDIIS